MAPDLLPTGVENDDPGAGARQAPGEARLGQQDGRPGILDHVRLPVGRIPGIHGNVGAAGLQNPEQTHHHLEGALDA